MIYYGVTRVFIWLAFWRILPFCRSAILPFCRCAVLAFCHSSVPPFRKFYYDASVPILPFCCSAIPRSPVPPFCQHSAFPLLTLLRGCFALGAALRTHAPHALQHAAARACPDIEHTSREMPMQARSLRKRGAAGGAPGPFPCHQGQPSR